MVQAEVLFPAGPKVNTINYTKCTKSEYRVNKCSFNLYTYAYNINKYHYDDSMRIKKMKTFNDSCIRPITQMCLQQ